MRGAFGQVHQLARTRFPGIEVYGTPYPLPEWKRPFVLVAQIVQMTALALCIGGDTVFRQLGIPPPTWYTQHVASNRFGAAMGVWFVGNMLVTNLQNTGAFEVYFDGQLIFSKLAEGRMPTVAELLGPIEAHFEVVAGGRSARVAAAVAAAAAAGGASFSTRGPSGGGGGGGGAAATTADHGDEL